MSLTPAMIDAMVAAGATVEVLAAAIKADLADRAEQTATKRNKDAERQRRHRERNAMSRDVTVTECDSVTDPSLSLPPNENNSNPPTHTHPDNTTRARGSDFPRPDWAGVELWADFLANRKAKRLKNTATAYRGFLSDIDRLQTPEWPPPRLLEHATAKGWGAIYQPDELKGSSHGRQAKPASNDEGPRNPYVRAVIASQAARAGNERGDEDRWPEHGAAAF